MPQETHEWQRERDKQRYTKWLESTERFEGVERREGRVSVLTVVVFLVIGALLLGTTANYILNGKAYEFINSTQQNYLLNRLPVKQDPVTANSSSQKTDESRKTQTGSCTTNDFANVGDVKIFQDLSDNFTTNIASARHKFYSEQMTKNEKISLYNTLALQSQGALTFYNEKLAKCYSNIAMANDMRSRAHEMKSSLREIQVLLH
jgi:hypothetical protein